MLKGRNGVTATKLRVVLAASMILILIIAIVSFWFFRNQLESYATEVRKANAAASVSEKNVMMLKQLEKELEDNAVAIARTEKIVGDSKFYRYQDQIIADINSYAKAAGIFIQNYSFLESTTPGTTDGSNAATSPQPAGPDGPPPAGLKTTGVSITLASPVDYAALMRFVHSIETNLTKMQLTGISITRQAYGSQNVATNPLNIEVYTR